MIPPLVPLSILSCDELYGRLARNRSRCRKTQDISPLLYNMSHHPKRTLHRFYWAIMQKQTNSVGLLKQLNWQPVEWRIKFKIARITYKTISTTQPVYVYSSLKHYTPSRTCVRLTLNCSFPVSAHVSVLAASLLPLQLFWNSLHLAIRSSVSTYSFRRQLKTFFYNLAFRPS